MDCVQLLRGRELEGESVNGFCVPVRACVCVCCHIKDCTKDRCATEIVRWFIK